MTDALQKTVVASPGEDARRVRSAPAWVSVAGSVVRRLPRGRYPAMRWLCRRRVAPFEARLGVSGGRMRFVCDLGDAIAREACFMGYYEPQETALARRLLRRGSTFVDVGANWGYFTLLAAHLVGRGGRVVSFEPHPELFRLLEMNLARNGLAQVRALALAVAGREGEMNLASFDEGAENSGTSRLTAEPAPGVANYRVPAVLLEPLLDAEGVGEIDLLKIDIEGGEGAVLPTLAGGLARARYRHVLLELHPEALKREGASAEGLVEFVSGFGYRAWRLDHSRQAFRRAAYRLPRSPREFLQPLDARAPLGEWPHVLFTAPGVETCW